MPNQFVTTVQERQLLACQKLMEPASNQDIRTHRVVNAREFEGVTSSVLFPTIQEQDQAFQWLSSHGFNPRQTKGAIVF